MPYAKPGKHEKLEHRGREFTLDKDESGHWQITDAAGTHYGWIEVITRHGADHDPVYNGYLVGHETFSHFGSDWRGITGSLVNDFEGEHRFAE